MTEADHADLSRRLALALGWQRGQLFVGDRGVGVWLQPPSKRIFLRYFDYRDPQVIWPIAERYDAFPVRLDATRWTAMYGRCGTFCYGYTAAEAVARAVIGAQK